MPKHVAISGTIGTDNILIADAQTRAVDSTIDKTEVFHKNDVLNKATTTDVASESAISAASDKWTPVPVAYAVARSEAIKYALVFG